VNPHRLYLAGPMSGLPEYNHPAFHAAASQLRAAGYTVISPTDNGLPPEAPWADHMRRDVVLMMQNATALATLPGHRYSRGAQIETNLAASLGMPVMNVEQWLEMVQAADLTTHTTAAAQEA